MLRKRITRFYYTVKPVLPASVRLRLRRWLGFRKREKVRGIWPIYPGSERPPENWPGWPNGKQFALVLTHDVEGQTGYDKIAQLMELELRLGFRSSFNLIPEGEYYCTPELRAELRAKGFEVGVHDLYHDGKLFLSEREFRNNVAKINHYLQDWSASGFRSGFMLHNLDWIHQLKIQYDASTFDTDPFEPQPQGRHTIFPFWVSRQPRVSSQALSSIPYEGYVELPYTLPQDSTLFLLLGERHPDIWMQKLDWIVKHGGMVLVDTHPDYMAFGSQVKKRREYPAELYERFLDYIRSKYAGCYWHALPREIAEYKRQVHFASRPDRSVPHTEIPARRTPGPKIWIDLDNTPHVPFFQPILEELKARGYPVVVTARDAFQVCDLADSMRLPYIRVGRHYGKNRLMKGLGLTYRAMQLAPLLPRERPALAVSHGARSQLMLCNFVRLPTVLIEDYEYSQFPPMMRPTWLIAPSVIPDAILCRSNAHLIKYPGIKEDVYAWKLKPDSAAIRALGIGDNDLLVTVRPPATEAHYHNPESELLFEAFMKRACATPGVRIVLLPRNQKQGGWIRKTWPQWFEGNRTIIPKAALDGMNLIWHSDLVVSGGGTMNREAAALCVPVYSIFRGTIGAVDKYLEKENRLILVESAEDVHRKIKLIRRPRKDLAEVTSKQTLNAIVDSIQQLAESVTPAA